MPTLQIDWPEAFTVRGTVGGRALCTGVRSFVFASLTPTVCLIDPELTGEADEFFVRGIDDGVCEIEVKRLRGEGAPLTTTFETGVQ